MKTQFALLRFSLLDYLDDTNKRIAKLRPGASMTTLEALSLKAAFIVGASTVIEIIKKAGPYKTPHDLSRLLTIMEAERDEMTEDLGAQALAESTSGNQTVQ